MKIGLISDTHGYLHPRVKHHFSDCDEIWHAGDIGNNNVLQQLESFKHTRAVYGNIDGQDIRKLTQEDLIFELAGLKVLITHIAGYPGKYNPRVLSLIKLHQPTVVICGHSHILKVMYDKSLNHLHINPGAAGNHGWHQVMTLVSFEISQSLPTNLKVIELGNRGAITSGDYLAGQ